MNANGRRQRALHRDHNVPMDVLVGSEGGTVVEGSFWFAPALNVPVGNSLRRNGDQVVVHALRNE